MAYKDREKYLASQRRYNQSHREERIALAKKWKIEHPELAKEHARSQSKKYYYDSKNFIKRKARRTLREAVKYGRIKKLPCVECGDIKSEGHHKDYSKPLDVVWLCRTHHMVIHRKV